jgi:DNA-directed RNA polymerase subunit F
MIKESRPLCMAEVLELAKDTEKIDEIKKFMKNFDVLSFEKAKELGDELRALGLMKLKEEHVVKIVDFVPVDSEDLGKTISEVSLDADEVNKILEVTKKYT